MPSTKSEKMAAPDLRIMNLRDLIPHEMVIHKHVAKILETIKFDGRQRDPIIVDRASSVVLDGTHRLRALTLAGATFAVVCLVDYDSIEMGRWLRQASTGSLKHLAEESNLKSLVSVYPPAKALQMVDNYETAFGLYSEQEAYVSNSSFNDIVEAYLLSEQIEHVLRSRKMRFSLIPDSTSVGDISSFSSAQTILYTPRIEKTDVLHNAILGRLFPPRSTRHVLSVRPVGIDFPVANLCMSERSLANANSVLASKLGTISPKLLPPGGSYHGRTYEERLLLYD
ncbi:MAG: hypothetical protein CMO12_01290 [Thaumarchaeota archaeon]|jgi:hypothetical protein|nr:hypothetical protein [Nitrososphaerota archaeon]|tara:strand:- start:7980 stop:8828 length:849 start_codon:yes stop_codon:yes gene_type:complete